MSTIAWNSSASSRFMTICRVLPQRCRPSADWKSTAPTRHGHQRERMIGHDCAAIEKGTQPSDWRSQNSMLSCCWSPLLHTGLVACHHRHLNPFVHSTALVRQPGSESLPVDSGRPGPKVGVCCWGVVTE